VCPAKFRCWPARCDTVYNHTLINSVHCLSSAKVALRSPSKVDELAIQCQKVSKIRDASFMFTCPLQAHAAAVAAKIRQCAAECANWEAVPTPEGLPVPQVPLSDQLAGILVSRIYQAIRTIGTRSPTTRCGRHPSVSRPLTRLQPQSRYELHLTIQMTVVQWPSCRCPTWRRHPAKAAWRLM